MTVAMMNVAMVNVAMVNVAMVNVAMMTRLMMLTLNFHLFFFDFRLTHDEQANIFEDYHNDVAKNKTFHLSLKAQRNDPSQCVLLFLLGHSFLLILLLLLLILLLLLLILLLLLFLFLLFEVFVVVGKIFAKQIRSFEFAQRRR